MNEFYHYGIKRRSGRYPWGSGDRPYQNSQEYKTAKSNIKNDAYINIFDDIYDPYQNFGSYDEWAKTMKKDFKSYRDLSHERVIKKESVAFRIGGDSEKNKGRTFICLDKKSNELYKDVVGFQNKERHVENKKFILKKDLKVPGNKEMVDTFLDLVFENKKVYVKEYMERSPALRRWMNDNTLKEKLWELVIEDPNVALTKFVSDGILRYGTKNIGKFGDKYIKKLESKGYDAIPDLNNFRDGLQDYSFLIFDRKRSLEEVDSYLLQNKPKTWEEKYEVEYIDKKR